MQIDEGYVPDEPRGGVRQAGLPADIGVFSSAMLNEGSDVALDHRSERRIAPRCSFSRPL
jgi:hypothetical protein